MARPSRADLAVAAVLAVLGQVELWFSSAADPRLGPGYAFLSLLAAGAVAFRSCAPLASASTCFSALAALAGANEVGHVWVFLVLLLVPYSAGRHAPLPRAAVGLVEALAFDGVLNIHESWGGWLQFIANYTFVAVLMTGVPWTAGMALRRRQLMALGEADHAMEVERRRIARELHDVVGHALGVIVVQAGAERVTLPPESSSTTLDTLLTIERTGREALTEMRRLLEVMRRDDDRSSLAPQPGLDQVDNLLRTMELAGIVTSLCVEGDPVSLPPGLDLSAYRIIQEALTNTLRHAHPSRSWVVIRYLPRALELEVLDDGCGPTRPIVSGFGLTGIRERVTLLGGTASIGDRPGRGYEVRVRLPLGARAGQR
jgi:signal transduction histidine kinase